VTARAVWSVHDEESGRLLAIADTHLDAANYRDAVPGSVIRRSMMGPVFELAEPELFEVEDEPGPEDDDAVDDDARWIVENADGLALGWAGDISWVDPERPGPHTIPWPYSWPLPVAIEMAERFGGTVKRLA
jgi:hypothetical protein